MIIVASELIFYSTTVSTSKMEHRKTKWPIISNSDPKLSWETYRQGRQRRVDESGVGSHFYDYLPFLEIQL